MKNMLFMVLIAALTIYITPQEFKKNATSGFTFLTIPVTARTAGLSESAIALSDNGSNSVFVNPAGLGFSEGAHSLALSYASYIADINHYAFSYSFSSDIGVVAVGMMQMDFGEMSRTVKSSGQKFFEENGKFGASGTAIFAGYSRRLTDKFAFGLAVKYVKESIDSYSADNFLLDGGVLYYTGLSSLRIAATINNFGTDSKYINDPFKMPSSIRLGAASEVLGTMESDLRVTLMAEAVHPNDGDERLNTGVEIGYNKMFFLRGGYKFFYDEETYSLGIGFNSDFSQTISADFSYADYGRLGGTLRFSLQYGL